MRTLTVSSVSQVYHVPISRLFTVMRGSERRGGSQPPRLLFSIKRVAIGIKVRTESQCCLYCLYFSLLRRKKKKIHALPGRTAIMKSQSKGGLCMPWFAGGREAPAGGSDQIRRHRDEVTRLSSTGGCTLATESRGGKKVSWLICMSRSEAAGGVGGCGEDGGSKEKRERWELVMPSLHGDAAAKRHGQIGDEAGSRSAAAGVRQNTHYADVAHRLAGNLTGEDWILEMVRKRNDYQPSIGAGVVLHEHERTRKNSN